MGSPFHYAPPIHDDDPVGVPDGGEAVGHHEHGPSQQQTAQCLLDKGFGVVVEGRGGFVEDEYPRVADEGSGDGQALLPAS